MQKIQYSQIIRHLKNNGLIIYPTETSYGLGADATNQKAVDLIFKIKQRSKKKTLPLIAGSVAMVIKNCELGKIEKNLAQKYWPGPLTLVLKSKDAKLAKGVTSKDKTVAIRVSSNKIAKNIAQKLGNPIISTSANITGEVEGFNFEDIKNIFAKFKNIMFIDGGRLPKSEPSTILSIVDDKIVILRQGVIKLVKKDRRASLAKS